MIYYAFGSALITGEELFTPSVSHKISEFTTSLAEKKAPDAIAFSTGKMDVTNFLTDFTSNKNTPVAFKPIGLGLPLTVMIREVYTGKYPKGNIFGGKKDMLVTSAIKSITSFEAKPKALNFMMSKVMSGSRIERPDASTQGTPYVFYSPALLEKSLTMDLTMVFDNFPEETFEQIGNFFTAAAGVPIFLAQSAYLIGAGILLKLIGEGGEAIFDGGPVFTSSDGIDIFLPGKPPIPPGFALITADNVDQIDPTFREKYSVNNSGEVVDSTGAAYKGEIPYVVISLDGEKNEDLSSFSPTAASAAVLSRFFRVKNKQEQSLDVLLNALKLYNDFSYRKQIDQIDKQLASTTDPEEIKALKDKRDALLKNILEDIIKPK
jgi:hypothetical protein